MKLALSGIEHFFEHQPIDALIDVADFLDITYVDLWVPRNTSVSTREEIKNKLLLKGKKVICVTTWSHLCKESGRDAEAELLRNSLEWAEFLNAPRVNTYFGYLNEKDDKRAIEIYRKMLSPILKEAEESGITICLENEFDSRGHDPAGSDITRSADSLLTLFKSVDSHNFRLTFDASNFYIAQEEYYPYAFELLKEYIDYIHLKDTRKHRGDVNSHKKKWSDHGREYIFCSLPEGAIEWGRFLSACAEYNNDWFCTLEPHTIYTNDEKSSPPDAGALKSRLINLMGKRVLEDYIESVDYVRALGVT